MQTSRVTEWVQLCERWCEPDWTHWCDGSPRDIARVMKLREDATATPYVTGGRGKCVSPTEAMTRIAQECRGTMRGRIMFVVPYVLPGDDTGILVTDSAAHAAQICLMARVGSEALSLLGTGIEFAAHLHLLGTETEKSEQIFIRCHLSGPAVTETACRIDNRQRRTLPLEVRPLAVKGAAPCSTCKRLCPNRARAIAGGE